jgi:hypothetical protein
MRRWGRRRVQTLIMNSRLSQLVAEIKPNGGTNSRAEITEKNGPTRSKMVRLLKRKQVQTNCCEKQRKWLRN